ncbi:hypothetical protein BV97_01937 [Novosphingobium resinovorum]|uniref:Benenodin family lasso peptide n=1 Tax=Novosphingobium resinovorum TaxID=158500 RepID=A0A031JZP0_9SPHN|nr:benenodin family lasso peptide [Novosphingobium resinovorum]EZP82440.1 hypothetical protein BV97_01937 [Novosphingobium resinovorum]
MDRIEVEDKEVIELGTASEATKGEALIDQDPGVGRLTFLSGIVAD